MDELFSILFADKSKYRSFPSIVKKHPGLHEWIVAKTCNLDTSNINERIYYILEGMKSVKCKYNNDRKFLTFTRGYGFCGRANKCKCCNEHSAKSANVFNDKTADEISQIVAKRKSTCTKRYGVDNPSKSQEIQQRKKETLKLNYGVENPMHSELIKTKLQNSNIARYGTTSPAKLDCVKAKAAQTNTDRYGDPYYSVRNHIDPANITLLDNIEYLIEQNKTKSLVTIACELGLSSSALYKKFKAHNINVQYHPNDSKFEKELRKHISSQLTCCVVANDRSILARSELDVLIPAYNIAIECNGSYWHSENNGKCKKYHNNKTTSCADKGVQLIHIWEHDWNTKQDLVKSRINAKLGINKRIYARKTKIACVSSTDAMDFLNKNHIQGSCPASVRYGLYHNDELVALMTFGKSRYKKDIKWELIRYCSKQGFNIVGGASKLLKYFMSMNAGDIISYSDRMWNNGGLYEAIGFEYSHTSEPAYYYTQNYINFENRVKYQKHKLPNILEIFDPDKTEWENMQANGYDRIWDCGNDVWILRR